MSAERIAEAIMMSNSWRGGTLNHHLIEYHHLQLVA